MDRAFIVIFTYVAMLTTGCIVDDSEEEPAIPKQEDQPLPTDTEWARYALIGGIDLWEDFTEEKIAALLDERKAQGVTVVEADSGLSQYLTDEQFESQLNLMRLTVKLARERGLKVVWYYPSLEVLTDDAVNNPSMAKDHPDWLQIGMDGRPNVFVGTKEFWVDEGTESAWMCPNGPYRDYYLDRIRRMAKTGLDGIWPDVPLFMDTAVMWNCVNDACKTKFREATKDADHPDGLETPTSPDINDPVFRRWLHWRHETIDDFIRAIIKAAKEVSPNIFIAVETFTMDYLDAMDKGLDGTYQRDIPGFTHVWEIDSVSNTGGMKCALPDDWTSKIAMFKFARGVDNTSPSWAFSYGNEPLDAGLVMAEAFAAQVNPYELKTPHMLSTVGHDFRTRWFGWAKEHLSEIYDSKSNAQVAIVFSSASRDYQDDQADGFGLYATADVQCGPDPDWWATGPGDSAYTKVHLGDYRGMAKLLVHAHIPFDIVPSQALSKERLARYKVVILPAMKAMALSEVEAVKEWVAAGGVLIVTGREPSLMDEYGTVLSDLSLSPVLGIHLKESLTLPSRLSAFGAGRVYWYADLLGQNYFDPELFKEDGHFSFNEVTRIIRLAGADPIWTDAPKNVHFETYISQTGDALYLHIVNFTGLVAPMVLSPVTITVELRPPEGRHASSIEATSPTEGAEVGPITFETTLFGRARFRLRVDQYTMLKVMLADGAQGLSPITPSQITDKSLKDAAEAAWAFIKNRMRDPKLEDPYNYGVFTNLADTNTSSEQYAYGHNVTSEHMGLTLLCAAAMGDRETFNGAARYVRDVMRSPFLGLVNWAIDKDTLKPLVQVDDPSGPPVNGNAPLDDFRVIRGLLLGHRVFGEDWYLKLARELSTGLRFTSVTDTDSDTAALFEEYPEGVVGYAYDWVETAPPHTGQGLLNVSPIPINYCDLAAIDELAPIDPWWSGVSEGCARLMLAAEIGGPQTPSGLFYGSYDPTTKTFSGDFEMPDAAQGKFIKSIQSLWTALHLARYGMSPGEIKGLAFEAALRALNFFRSFYETHGRIPEYLTFDGNDVPNCVVSPTTTPCLYYSQPGVAYAGDDENLFEGEPRIYALLAKLAYELGDANLAKELVFSKILPFQDTDPSSPNHGNIGAELAGDRLAEAWNILESILAILEVSGSGLLL